MLESLFEKEAKRMEIDMKADMFGIAIVPKFRLLYGTRAMSIIVSSFLCNKVTVGLSMVRLLQAANRISASYPV